MSEAKIEIVIFYLRSKISDEWSERVETQSQSAKKGRRRRRK